ncbi:MAG: YetF domain-containing protein [Bacteroidota bacterium]
MGADEIRIDDWQRILTGNVPGSFYVEVVIRLLFLYLLLLAGMRLMGKRMSAMLTRNELAAMVVMAAAIGVPVSAPDRGLLPSVIIAAIVVATERAISGIAFRNKKFEKASQGDISVLISDAVMDVQVMEEARIGRDRIMAQLRSQSIKSTGEVKRLYLEAGGTFSLIKEERPGPGLSVIPDWDTAYQGRQKAAGVMVCGNCAGKSRWQQLAPTVAPQNGKQP